MSKKLCSFGTLLLAGLLAAPTPAFARIKLITLPVRERVDIQLDHDDATLVEEERIVPLVAGENQIDFSWANTSIDPSTLVFRVLGPAGDDQAADNLTVNILSVTYPPGENALVWQVSSSASTSVLVRISYLLGGLSKSFNYRAVAEHDEKSLTLAQYIKVQNFAGEAYDDTEIYAGFGDKFLRPIGLNETRQMLVETVQNVPIQKTYTADLHRYGWLDQSQYKLRVPMHYRLQNDADHQLGQGPLPPGKVRLFLKESAADSAEASAATSGGSGASGASGGGTAFIGEDWANHTPVGNHMDLFLGLAQDIVIKRTIEDRRNDRVAGNLYNKSVTLKYEIENFKDEPVTLNVAEQIDLLRQELGISSDQPAEWVLGDTTTLEGQPVADDTTQEQLTFAVDLPARQDGKAEKVTRLLQIVFKNQW